MLSLYFIFYCLAVGQAKAVLPNKSLSKFDRAVLRPPPSPWYFLEEAKVSRAALVQKGQNLGLGDEHRPPWR